MNLDFIQLKTDFYIYIKKNIIVEVYVNDIKIVDFIITKCQLIYHEVVKYINIEMKDFIKSFLDINIIHN